MSWQGRVNIPLVIQFIQRLTDNNMLLLILFFIGLSIIITNLFLNNSLVIKSIPRQSLIYVSFMITFGWFTIYYIYGKIKPNSSGWVDRYFISIIPFINIICVYGLISIFKLLSKLSNIGQIKKVGLCLLALYLIPRSCLFLAQSPDYNNNGTYLKATTWLISQDDYYADTTALIVRWSDDVASQGMINYYLKRKRTQDIARNIYYLWPIKPNLNSNTFAKIRTGKYKSIYEYVPRPLWSDQWHYLDLTPYGYKLTIDRPDGLTIRVWKKT
jgi:hypothetical protein